MKKKPENEEEKEHEILKAVAQAWLGHSGTSRPTNEFDAFRNNHKNKATRFKHEAAMKKLSKESSSISGSNWDFQQSLWDSYEIVTVSKRLEEGMVLDHPMSLADGRVKKRKESKNSLRSLLSTSKKLFEN
ncbi:hypothetical protein ACHQM5_011044 [Ranunculus cassubicifolius]